MNTYFKSWFYLLNFKDLLFFFVINDSKWAWLLAGQNRQIEDIILTTGKLWLIDNWNWKWPYAKFHQFDIRVIWGKELYYVLMESAENQMGQWKKAIRTVLCCKEDQICAKACASVFCSAHKFWQHVGVGHLMRILPPLLPFVGVVGGNGQITNGGVKPHVEYLQRQQESWVTWDAIFASPAGSHESY